MASLNTDRQEKTDAKKTISECGRYYEEVQGVDRVAKGDNLV